MSRHNVVDHPSRPHGEGNMPTIDVFYQGEGIAGVEHLEIEPDRSFGELKGLIAKKHGLIGDLLLFLEDCDAAMDDAGIVSKHRGRAGLMAHIHRCRAVEVAVNFKEKTVHEDFPPSATVERVKRWAAERKFGMSEEDASHHHLQIAGTTEQPDPGVHIGRLATCPNCALAFDLVPTPRVNGASVRT